jgi:Ca-activated chloride channel homolog
MSLFDLPPADAPAAAPRFTFAIDRALVAIGGASVRYLVASVTAPAVPAASARPRLPVHVALVLDASGSMAGERLAAARTAAAKVIASLRPDDRVSLVSFASDVVMHVEAAALDADGRERLAAAIAALTTRGSTDLCAGWLRGCEAVAGRLAIVGDAERRHVVVLSDGHANHGIVDAVQLAQHATELRRRGVPTSTVGIGDGYSPAQLQAIAEAGGGRMHDATEPSEIAEVLLAELGDVLATTVEACELTVQLPPGVAASVCGTAPTTAIADGIRVHLGALLAGARRECVIKLTFPPGLRGDVRRIAARASWHAPLARSTHQLDLPDVAVRYATGDECLAQPRDVALARTVLVQWHADVAHRAMVMNQRDEVDDARALVERELAYFTRYAEGVPDSAELVRSLANYAPYAGHRQSAMVAKEVMLASYKRSRGEVDRRHRLRESLEDQMGSWPGTGQR